MEIYKALVAFRAEAPVIKFDATNPFFKSKYATLGAIHKAIDPLLAKHGLAVLQFPISGEDGVGCRTLIVHESGESLEGEFTLPLAKSDPQGAGAAITYARRYGISGALCLITDDDNDGNMEASPPVAKAGKKAPRAKVKPSMSDANKAKLKFIAKEKLIEVGEKKGTEGEVIDFAARELGYSSRIELLDADYDKASDAIDKYTAIPF